MTEHELALLPAGRRRGHGSRVVVLLLVVLLPLLPVLLLLLLLRVLLLGQGGRLPLLPLLSRRGHGSHLHLWHEFIAIISAHVLTLRRSQL